MDSIIDVRDDRYPAWFSARSHLHQRHLWWRRELRYVRPTWSHLPLLHAPYTLYTVTLTCAEFLLLLHACIVH